MEIYLTGARYGLLLGIVGFVLYLFALLLKTKTSEIKKQIKEVLITLSFFIGLLIILSFF